MFIQYFLGKSKIFPIKKHSFCRKLFSDREDPGGGGVEACADSKKPRPFLQKINIKFSFAFVCNLNKFFYI